MESKAEWGSLARSSLWWQRLLGALVWTVFRRFLNICTYILSCIIHHGQEWFIQIFTNLGAAVMGMSQIALLLYCFYLSLPLLIGEVIIAEPPCHLAPAGIRDLHTAGVGSFQLCIRDSYHHVLSCNPILSGSCDEGYLFCWKGIGWLGI